MRFGKERAKDWGLMNVIHHWKSLRLTALKGLVHHQKRLCLAELKDLVHHWKMLHFTGLKGVKGAISFERVFMLYVFDLGSVGLWRI